MPPDGGVGVLCNTFWIRSARRRSTFDCTADEQPAAPRKGGSGVLPGTAWLSVTEGARVLGVSRQALSNLVNGRARISGDMAIRLAKACGSTTESWIHLQAVYDVAQAQAREQEIEVDRYEPQPGL